MKQEITIYAISDSLGGTSQKLLSAVMAQYPDLIFNNSYRFPFINKESELLDILQDAIKDDAVVISTLVDSHLAATAREFSRVNHLSYLDLMNPFFEIIKEKQARNRLRCQEFCTVWTRNISIKSLLLNLLLNMTTARTHKDFWSRIL